MTTNSHFITQGIKAAHFPVLSVMVVRVQIQEEVTVETSIAHIVLLERQAMCPKRAERIP
jgi:hypothetical protein